MQGIDYFPRDDERAWAQQFDRRVRDFMTIRIREGRDFTREPMTTAEYNAIFQRQQPEYAEWRRVQDREINALWNVPELDVSALPTREFDRPKLAPFKLEYDTLQEVQMRFRQTVIQIKGNPFYVSDIRADRNQPRRYVFLTEDVADRKAHVSLDQIEDMRSVPPGFVQMDGYSAWMCRSPARVNQQGLTGQNVLMRRVSSGDNIPVNQKAIVKGLDSKGKVTRWTPQYRDLMVNGVVREMRLSDEVALFHKKEDVYVAYKGRVFGKLQHGNLVAAMDEDDLIQPWIGRHFSKVDLEVRNA